MKALRIFAAVLVAALALSCKSNSGVKVEDVELPTRAEVDSASYLIGINLGSFLKNNQFCDDLSELNMSEIKKGMEDFINAKGNMYDEGFDEQFKINPNKMYEILNGFISKRVEYKNAVNLAEGEKFLADNLKNGAQVTESGLQYLLESEGDEYKVQPNDSVLVRYTGKTIDGNVFDSNVDAEEPTWFVANHVIKGWTEGLGLLGKGGKATFFIPSELGYGKRGSRGIEPNSVLVFDVEVIDIVAHSDAE